MLNDRRRFSVRSLIWIASGLIGAAVAAIGLTVWGFRSDAVHNAVNDVDNLATVLAEQTARSIQAIDLTLTELQQRFVIPSAAGGEDPYRQPRSRETHDLLSERASRLPQAAVITLADNTGHIIAS
jgi:hypothetical protein